MKNNIKISVIVPVFNVEEYLSDCLNSLISQTLSEIEIICVDDCSTDSSLTILNNFKGKDSRIKILENKFNMGQGASRNYAMKHVSGKYVLFLDSDDWLDVNTLEVLYDKIEKESADLIMFKLINFDQKLKRFFKTDYYSMDYMDSYKDQIFNFESLGNQLIFRLPNSPCNKLFSYSFLKENNICFPSGLIFEDNPFYFKVMYNAKKILFCDNYFYNRRIRSNSTTTHFGKNLVDIIEISDIVLSYFLDNNLYDKCKFNVLNYAVQVMRDRFYKIDDEYKSLFYDLMYNKVQKFNVEYDLNDDLRNNLSEWNLLFYNLIMKSESLNIFNENVSYNKLLNKFYSKSVIIVVKDANIKEINDIFYSIQSSNYNFEDLDVIFVDDCSDIKEAFPLLQEFNDLYPNVRTFFLENNISNDFEHFISNQSKSNNKIFLNQENQVLK